MAKEVRAVHAGLEPLKNKANKRDMGEIYSQNPILLPTLVQNLLTQDPVRVFELPKDESSDGDRSLWVDPE